MVATNSDFETDSQFRLGEVIKIVIKVVKIKQPRCKILFSNL